MTEQSEDFEIANRAFDLFTVAERERALERFAGLKYASLKDRWFDAIHFVIQQQVASRIAKG